MPKDKLVVLPIEGNKGKYIVHRLKDNSLVLIAQTMELFPTHSDLITEFAESQKKSAEDVFKKYDRYARSDVRLNIRDKSKLVRALQQFSMMSKAKERGLEGGGFYQLGEGIIRLYGESETYWGVPMEILEKFRAPLETYFQGIGEPRKIIID